MQLCRHVAWEALIKTLTNKKANGLTHVLIG